MNQPFQGSDRELDLRTRRIDLAHEADIELGPVIVRPSLRQIAGPDGETMLEPKVMLVLVALATPFGAILSRDDLIERCWEGRVVGDTSINRVISLLRGALKTVAAGAICVENVPKVGYRLIEGQSEPCDRSHPAASAAPTTRTESVPWYRKRMVAPVIAALLLLVGALGLGAYWQAQPAASPERLRIAMLPLDLGAGVDPLYGTGLETELRSQFARVGLIEVTSGDSASHLIAKGLSPMEVGRKLKADYVWSGALDVEAERVILSARLLDVAEGQEVWDEQLASAPGAARFLPARLARAVADALGRPVAESTLAGNVSNEDFSLYLTAMGLIKTRGTDQLFAARDIMEQVTQRSPDFAAGWAGLAKSYYLLPEGPGDTFEETALEHAKYALRLDPDSVDALKIAGMMSEDASEQLDYLRRAVELDPGDVEAWFWLGLRQRMFQLEADSFLESSLRMIELDPLWPASWQASDHAAEFGRLDLARVIENEIGAAAVTPAHERLAQARAARLEGDLSTYVEQVQNLNASLTATQRRFSVNTHMGMIGLLLGVELPGKEDYSDKPEMVLLSEIYRSELPSLAALETFAGEDGDIWALTKLIGPALPLFVQEGRTDELLAAYDARFGDHDAYLAYARADGREAFVIPQLSPTLAWALREAGRDSEAQAHIESAERQLARWDGKGLDWIVPLLWEINLAAVKGERDRAAALVSRLPDFAWPYSAVHPEEASLLLLSDNPMMGAIQDDPRVREVLDPIIANVQRERGQVLALSL
jgi:DNA-binding winged helix-turn-helix (wHTH) protein/TolB-like protein